MKKSILAFTTTLILVLLFMQPAVAQDQSGYNHESENPERFEDVPEEFRANLTHVVETYLNGKDAFLKSDLDASLSKFESFKNKQKKGVQMKEIKAMIRPEMFEEVYSNLRSEGFCCLTVYHGEGIGRHGNPDKLNASLEFPFLHSKIVKIEMVVADEHQDDVINIIQQAACTHNKGDGIIYSSDIEKAISIRTGEEDSAFFG